MGFFAATGAPVGSSFTDWLTAIGTTAAVVVAVGLAIGIQWWTSRVERRRIPRLTIEKDGLWYFNFSGWPSLRLAVQNEPGGHAAHDVQVTVDCIREAGAFRHLPNAFLRWDGIYDSNAALRPMTIPAGARRYIDLGSFIDRGRAAEVAHPALKLPTLYGGGYEIETSPCRFNLTVTASNCDATEWTATLKFQRRMDESAKPESVSLDVDLRSRSGENAKPTSIELRRFARRVQRSNTD